MERARAEFGFAADGGVLPGGGARVTRGLEEAGELVYGEAGFPDEAAQGALGELGMEGDGEAAVGRVLVAENDVAAGLAIEAIADAGEGFDCFAAGERRELHPTGTSTISSWMPGGIGSPWCLRLSR